VDAVDEYVALGGGQGVGDLTAVPTHDLDDLCFGQLVVATAQGFQRGEDVQELFGGGVCPASSNALNLRY